MTECITTGKHRREVNRIEDNKKKGQLLISQSMLSELSIGIWGLLVLDDLEIRKYLFLLENRCSNNFAHL